MKYQSSNTKRVYDFDFGNAKKRHLCPECSESRKKSKSKDLEFYPETNSAYCFHCETTLFEYKPNNQKIEYKVPEWKNTTKLSDKAVKYFTGRMISQATLNKMKVYTSLEYMPQFEREVETICFPYFKDETLINIKYRGAQKSFKLYSGAELIWYNYNALKENKEIIICEGEIDALTWIENGFENVVSVPNGANNNLQYLDSSIELFEDIEKIYLSTDNDTKGIELRDELIRRFGAEKCLTLNFMQFKDANEFFCKVSGNDLKDLIKNAKQVPINGIINVNDFYTDIIDLYENGEKNGVVCNNKELDNFVTWELGRLMIITGVPGSGKSEFVDDLICRLNFLYGWKVGLFTPENYPLKYHYRKIHSKFSGRKFDKNADDTDFYSIYEYVKDNFFYILDEENMTVNKIMELSKYLVKSKGIKILVLDPYNKFDHQQERGESETQYISKFLDTLVKFARFNNILLILVAHPRKVAKDEIPNLYDIAGSAHFYNKTDYGITVHRVREDETGLMTNYIEVYIQKVKFKHLGSQGVAKFQYNVNNGRFESREAVQNWDNAPWIKQAESFDFSDIKDIEF